MNIDEFRQHVQRKFPNLQCKKQGKTFWTTDGSISYNTSTSLWSYRLSKSSGGLGSTLDEAIANAHKAESEGLFLYDE